MALLILLLLHAFCGAQIMRRDDDGRPRTQERRSREEGLPAPAPAPVVSPAPGAGPISPRPAPRPAPERRTQASPLLGPGMPGMGSSIRRQEPFSPGARPSAPLRSASPVRRREPADFRAPAPGVGVRAVERGPVVPGRSTLHRWRDAPYWHHWDGRSHWYGWRRGDRFYWARPYAGYWWWFDPAGLRWCFWWSGYWWWAGPGGTLYIDAGDGFRPYDAVAVVPPPVTADPGGSVLSPDGRRTVQLTGPAAEAFLYDSTGPSPVYLGFLGRGVERVRFSGGAGGAPLRILIDFKDGRFVFADEDGRPLTPGDEADPAALPGPPPSVPAAPPASPSELPPPPPAGG